MSVAAIRGACQARAAGLRALRGTLVNPLARAYHGPKTTQELELGQSDAVSCSSPSH